MATKKKNGQKADAGAKRVTGYYSLSGEDGARLDAFIARETARTGALPKRGAHAAQLIRLGLAQVEAAS